MYDDATDYYVPVIGEYYPLTGATYYIMDINGYSIGLPKYRKYKPEWTLAILKAIRRWAADITSDARNERLDPLMLFKVPCFREKLPIFRWGYSHCN